MNKIQRIVVTAKPAASHPDFFEWQTASVCLFVPEDDRTPALQKARAELSRRHWEFIDYQDKSTLIEERVREQGGEVWDAYQYACSGAVFVRIFPHHFGAGDLRFQWMRPAKITEEFMDQVVTDAGGRRLTDAEKGNGKNADYLLGHFILELKDLQEEALGKGSHQEKLADLFFPYFPGADQVPIDPTVLSKKDFGRYLDILGKPIQGAVKSASKQIRETKTRLGDSNWSGGVIILNSGLGSFPQKAFTKQVERYALKDSTQIDVVISINTWSHTNGFDTHVFYEFSPPEPWQQEVAALKHSFDQHFEKMMTDLVKGDIPSTAQRADPLKPTAFHRNGIDFAWVPHSIPLPWENE